MNEQLLLDKWQKLESEEQAKVLAFIDSIFAKKQQETSSQPPETVYQPQTELGKKLWEIRQKAIKDRQIKLLDWDDIEAELDEIRGRNR